MKSLFFVRISLELLFAVSAVIGIMVLLFGFGAPVYFCLFIGGLFSLFISPLVIGSYTEYTEYKEEA